MTEYIPVILRFEDMTITEDAFGELYWAEIPEEYAEPGQMVEIAFMHELDRLPPQLQRRIRAARDAMPPDLLAALTGTEGGGRNG